MSVTKIQTQVITDSAVTTDKIAQAAVTTNRIANNQVTSAKIADSAVGTSQIADDAITNAKIDNGAVKTNQITNQSVTSAKIANDAVTSAKIADSAVGTSQIAAEAVTAGKLSGDQSGSAPIYGVRAWGIMTGGSSGSPSVTTAGNISSISRSGSTYTVNFSTNMPNSNYAVMLTIGSDSDHTCQVSSRGRSQFKFTTYDAGDGNNETDATSVVHIMVVG